MRIAFYIKPFAAGEFRPGSRDAFAYESLSRIIKRHPGHTYFLVEDGPLDEAPPFDGLERFSLPQGGLFGDYRKYQLKLPALLKKLEATVVLSLTGTLPLKGSVPSLAVVPNGASADPEIARFIRVADVVATLSGSEADALSARDLVSRDQIFCVPPAVPEVFQPLGWEAREQVKEDYTDSREYFIHLDPVIDEAALIRLLKGFSVLKKRLRSSMALVLAGEMHLPEAKITGLLRSYHFRGDVKCLVCADLLMRTRLVGGAYALVTASAGTGFGVPVLEALRSRVPVVAASEAALQETAAEAALYFKPGDAADLGERFCDIYKYENLRARLIEKADAQALLYSWDKTVDVLWEGLLNAVQAKK